MLHCHRGRLSSIQELDKVKHVPDSKQPEPLHKEKILKLSKCLHCLPGTKWVHDKRDVLHRTNKSCFTRQSYFKSAIMESTDQPQVMFHMSDTTHIQSCLTCRHFGWQPLLARPHPIWLHTQLNVFISTDFTVYI
jgi:hypothetical protein